MAITEPSAGADIVAKACGDARYRTGPTEIAAALQSEQVKEAFAKIGVRRTLGATGYGDLVRSELARWKDVIRTANVNAD